MQEFFPEFCQLGLLGILSILQNILPCICAFLHPYFHLRKDLDNIIECNIYSFKELKYSFGFVCKYIAHIWVLGPA